jgi:protein-S-isoprenylcysteine O-methyltransferase Ste14
VHLAQPDRLVTTGPYAVIRHPMYVAWGLIHLGLGLATGSRWTLLTAPLAAVVVHRETIAEEQRLLASFPAQMRGYRVTTPAYVPRWHRPPRR